MGYILSSISEISSDDDHLFFVFYIKIGDFSDDISGWIDNNFGIISNKLGSKAVIVRGTKDSFNRELFKTYDELIDSNEFTNSIKPLSGNFILLTNIHPKKLFNENNKILYLVSLNDKSKISAPRYFVWVNLGNKDSPKQT